MKLDGEKVTVVLAIFAAYIFGAYTGITTVRIHEEKRSLGGIQEFLPESFEPSQEGVTGWQHQSYEFTHSLGEGEWCWRYQYQDRPVPCWRM